MTNMNQLIENARTGKLTLHLNVQEFDKVITACNVYIDGLRELCRKASNLALHPLGFSEDHLDSGKQIAQVFQRKAAGGTNSAESTFLSHIDQIEEITTLLVVTRDNIVNTDGGNARNITPHGH